MDEDSGHELLLAFKAVVFINGVPSSPQRKDAKWSRDGIIYAECEHSGHRPPGETCSCGIYATTSRAILRGYIHQQANLLCPVLLVSACGTTEVWTSGWRAEAAQAHYIVDLSRDQEIRGVSRANQVLSLSTACGYFELPVVSFRSAVNLIRASWEECGYKRRDRNFQSHALDNPDELITDSALAFTK